VESLRRAAALRRAEARVVSRALVAPDPPPDERVPRRVFEVAPPPASRPSPLPPVDLEGIPIPNVDFEQVSLTVEVRGRF